MKLFSTLILITSICKLIICGGYFSVFGSKFLAQNGKYSVAIISRNFTEQDVPFLDVAITGDSWRMTQYVALNNNGTNQNIAFNMEDQPDNGEYVFSVHYCISGQKFNQSVNLITTNVSVIVQTDKAIYKANDKVQFRVLVLNENLKPLNESKVQIYVTDGAQYRVKQFDVVIGEKGVFQGELKLSDSPILGKWHIVVHVGKKTEVAKAFEVAEYVLPTFQLLVDAKPHKHFNETIINATIVAKYTFGEMVTGNATITAEVDEKQVTKSIKMNGNVSVEFHIENDLGIKEINRDRTVRLFVKFVEELTGRTQNTTANVQLHVLPYKITMKKKSKKLKPGLPFTIETFVQYFENNRTINDSENPVSFVATLDMGLFSLVKKLEIYPSNGISKIDLLIPEDIRKLSITAKYLQSEISEIYYRHTFMFQNHFIEITSKTDIPQLSENVKINILSVKAFAEFSYHVLTNMGRLILSDTVQLPSPTTNHDFEFTPTHDMEADVKIIVFYITDDGEIVADSLLLEFNELRNFVDISIPDERVSPNDVIKINIKSNHDSFVGLMGVDQSVLIQKGGNDISDSVFNEVDENGRNGPDVFFITYKDKDAISSGVELSSLDHTPDTTHYYKLNELSSEHREDKRDRLTEFETIGVQRQELRTSFLETWLFENVNLARNETTATIIRKVPDTITSFAITAFSLNLVTGLALTKSPTMLSVFKPLFISIDLPYSIKFGEIISMPVSVFNYMDDDQYAEVTFFNEDSEFAFVDADNEIIKQGLLSKEMKKMLFVKQQSVALTSFKIRASRTGSIKVKVDAKSTLSAGDWVERDLLVEPVGRTQFKKKAILIDLSNSRNYTTDIFVPIPPEAIHNSIRIEASVVGDILGLPTENVNELINVQHASSEQNMIFFARKMVVLDYLRAVNRLTPQNENDLTKQLEIGYQKQLNYRHDDGSFSMWNLDDLGSTWLTAFVAKSFRQAAKHIFVGENIIKAALRFLSQKQSEDGSFVEHSKDTIPGGSADGIALTAHVLITFLENTDYSDEYKIMTAKSCAWLSKNINNITDNYTLAIVTYALQLAHQLGDETMKNDSLSKLEEKAIKGGEMMRWEGNIDTLDIETTAYALHAFIEADRLTDSVRIIKWLVSQRKENGGYVSVIALQAMSKVAQNLYSPNTDIKVTIQYSGNESTLFNVNKTNALLLMKEALPSSERLFSVTATGEGFSILQISYQYNIETLSNETHIFNISRVTVKSTANKSTFSLKVCTNNIPDAENVKYLMTVMEVNFPSGCTFRKDLSKRLKSTKEIKIRCSSYKIELFVILNNFKQHVDDRRETSIVLYISSLSVTSVCPQFFFSRDTIVDSLQPASIHIYDYHNIRRKALTFYNLPPTNKSGANLSLISVIAISFPLIMTVARNFA